jgi:pimeloyl-ACP methyl ester carboxylesterase
MPCLWLLAEADAIVPYALADALVVLHPQSQIKKISQAGHLPFITQAEQTQQAILDFLD